MKYFAFKEWQVVCDALATGEQTLILRKGGIAEGKLGFQWLHESFLLCPTFFHEQLAQVKGERPLRPAPPEGSPVAFELFAEIKRAARLSRWEDVELLEPHHIWTESAVRERFEWGDEPGISLAIIRVWRLAQPWTVEWQPSFGGCRSWFGLPEHEGDLLRGAEPVLSEEALAGRMDEIVAGVVAG